MGKSIVVHDVNKAKVEAEVLDLNHGLQFVPMATLEGSDDIEVCRDADVVVITAGAKQKPGQTRMDLAAGDLNIAQRRLEQAIAAEPEYLLAHTLMGLVRAGRGDLRGAADAFRRAAELDPKSPEAWNNLGASLENLGDVTGAIAAYERALAADPTFEKAQRNLNRARGSAPR